jgi:hypothetical protein
VHRNYRAAPPVLIINPQTIQVTFEDTKIYEWKDVENIFLQNPPGASFLCLNFYNPEKYSVTEQFTIPFRLNWTL